MRLDLRGRLEEHVRGPGSDVILVTARRLDQAKLGDLGKPEIFVAGRIARTIARGHVRYNRPAMVRRPRPPRELNLVTRADLGMKVSRSAVTMAGDLRVLQRGFRAVIRVVLVVIIDGGPPADPIRVWGLLHRVDVPVPSLVPLSDSVFRLSLLAIGLELLEYSMSTDTGEKGDGSAKKNSFDGHHCGVIGDRRDKSR